MNVPKIKRDITKTKIINSDEIITYLKYYMEDFTLPNYKNALLNQEKVSEDEVKPFIDVIDTRINMFNDYNNIKEDFDKLEVFFSENISYIKGSIKELYSTNSISIATENLITGFLNYLITNEESGIQNNLEFQNIFDTYKKKFDNKEFVPKIYFYNKIKDIMDRKDSLLNKTDQDANDYFEKEIDDNSYGGFIFTSIILESSIVLALIISLIILFK